MQNALPCQVRTGTTMRAVTRITVEVTIPLSDESWDNPWDLAVAFVEQSGMYPGVTFEGITPDRYDFDYEPETVIVTLTEAV